MANNLIDVSFGVKMKNYGVWNTKVRILGYPTASSIFHCSQQKNKTNFNLMVKPGATIQCEITPKGYGLNSGGQLLSGIDCDSDDFEKPYFVNKKNQRLSDGALADVTKFELNRQEENQPTMMLFRVNFKEFKENGTYCLKINLRNIEGSQNNDSQEIRGKACFDYKRDFEISEYSGSIFWAVTFILIILLVVSKKIL